MHRGEQVAGLHSELLSPPDCFWRSGEFFKRAEATGAVQGPAAASEQKILGAVLLVDLILVGQIVADGGDVEIAGLDQRLYGLHYWRLEVMLLVLCVPRGF